MMSKPDNERFDVICDLFCHLANALEKEGDKDISAIVEHLMSVWLDKALVK